MPGTIQVSVLEFLPPQPSSSFSEMSLKISMGRRECQTLDKGDFSFPLNSLRDNLIVTLQNAEGKEISHSVIETKMVIEKGVWDDLFPLEGGGRVHMKLQFILSEADRHRIRIMRESALKKKHDELLKSEVRSPKQSSMIRSYSASSLPTNQEVSDSHKLLLRNEVIQAILPSTSATFTLFKAQSSIKKESNPVKDYSTLYRYKDASSSNAVRLEEVSHGRLVEKTAINVHGKTNFVEAASSSGSSRLVRGGKFQADKQNLLDKNPSKIRNMISAFESSLHQDMRPKIRPASGSKHLNQVDLENSELAQLSGRVNNPIHMIKIEENTKTGFLQPTGYSKELTTGLDQSKGTAVNLKNKAKFTDKIGIQEEKTSSEGIARTLTGEKASVSGRMVSQKHKNQLNSLFQRRASGENLLKQTNKNENQANNLQPKNCEGASADEPYSSESERERTWIFPDGGKRLCITAGGKQVMDLMENFHLQARTQPSKLNPEEENLKKGNYIQVKEDSKAPGRHENPKTEDSTDAESSRRPVGKVMRVVIMVGFATLVFFTRQRD